MKMADIPFGTTDWSSIERTEHKLEKGIIEARFMGSLSGFERRFIRGRLGNDKVYNPILSATHPSPNRSNV